MCCSAYEGDWRETFLDGNRGNRSAVLDWKMETMGPAIGGEDVEQEGGDGEVRVGNHCLTPHTSTVHSRVGWSLSFCFVPS